MSVQEIVAIVGLVPGIILALLAGYVVHLIKDSLSRKSPASSIERS